MSIKTALWDSYRRASAASSIGPGIGPGVGEEWLPAGGNEGRRYCERREGDGCEGVRTPSLSLFCDQLVAGAADVDDADAGVFDKAVAEAGDKDLEAAAPLAFSPQK